MNKSEIIDIIYDLSITVDEAASFDNNKLAPYSGLRALLDRVADGYEDSRDKIYLVNQSSVLFEKYKNIFRCKFSNRSRSILDKKFSALQGALNLIEDKIA